MLLNVFYLFILDFMYDKSLLGDPDVANCKIYSFGGSLKPERLSSSKCMRLLLRQDNSKGRDSKRGLSFRISVSRCFCNPMFLSNCLLSLLLDKSTVLSSGYLNVFVPASCESFIKINYQKKLPLRYKEDKLFRLV